MSPQNCLDLVPRDMQSRPQSEPARDGLEIEQSSLSTAPPECPVVSSQVNGFSTLLPAAQETHRHAPKPERSGGSASRLRLQGEIARGGMGCVFLGRDLLLARYVAVKVLLGKHLHKPEMQRRFLEEARITGRLQHPGVVPVLRRGPARRWPPLFRHETGQGPNARGIAQPSRPESGPGSFPRHLPRRKRTVAHAHRGVVHRDLKPSNVMVGEFGEAPRRRTGDWRRYQPRAGEQDDPGLTPRTDEVVCAVPDLRRHDLRLLGRRRHSSGDGDGDAGLHGPRAGTRRGRVAR